MKLMAKVTDEELFRKWTHELGTILYTIDSQGVIKKVVYHSGSKTVILSKPQGISEQLAHLVKGEGFLVDELEIDEMEDYVRIVQGSLE
jgi:hypothetical protein